MNTDLAYASLGPCEEYEFDLVEWIDGALAPDRANAVRRHVDSCARCRAFERQMRAVDESLAEALPRVQLSADFDARLRDRIGHVSRSFSKDVARAQEEHEYRSILHGLRRGLTWGTALNALAAAAVGAGVALGLDKVSPSLVQAIDVAGPVLGQIGLGVSGLALVGGVLAARSMRRASTFLLFG
jgi:anti-sigma factor RsiW